MPQPAQSTLLPDPPEAEKSRQFYYMPVVRRAIAIRDPYPSTNEADLMEIDGYGVFVCYRFGNKPTLEEVRAHIKNCSVWERRLFNVFIEAGSPEEAKSKFLKETPGANHCADPALWLDRHRGREIRAMPPCGHMRRTNDSVQCEISIDDETGNNNPCIVSKGFPPPTCPIDALINPHKQK